MPNILTYLFRMSIVWAYRKYCRDFWHEEMWEIAKRVSENTRNYMYYDLSSRIDIETLKKKIEDIKDDEYKYVNLGYIYKEIIGKRENT